MMRQCVVDNANLVLVIESDDSTPKENDYEHD